MNINPDVIESSKGMGMTNKQVLKLVQLPLAFPIIMTGIRISAVTAVGLMTIAAFIGAGGLGYMVFSGVANCRQQYDSSWSNSCMYISTINGLHYRKN